MKFFKYHGTGNDFILVDNRSGAFTRTDEASVAALCHRRFGIGADGLILLAQASGYDFQMDYFNSDGRRSSMCGNGGRCITHFAMKIGLVKDQARFLAVDGPHEAHATDRGIRLKMGSPSPVTNAGNDYVVNTGSPHFVRFVKEGIESLDVKKEGAAIRYSTPYADSGINVNFARPLPDGSLRVRTYERGVEDETWSCGTGVTAVAVVHAHLNPAISSPVSLHTPGGPLWVHFAPSGEWWLEGAAVCVFEGEIPT